MPAGDAERQQITATLAQLSSGAHWEQEYRTAYVMAGLPQERLITREDVEQIPVPPRRRLVGELAVWQTGVQKPPSDDLKVEGTDNTWLHLRLRQHAFEGQPWSQLSEPENPEEMLGYLFQHPALQLEGEVMGRYTAEQTQGGQISWTPEPEEETRGALDTLARRWHGETPEEWAQIHAERLAQDPDETDAPKTDAPSALRSTFELRQPSPLRSFFTAPFDVVGEFEVFPIAEEQAYSLDGGQSWLDYPAPDETEGGEEFEDFNDVETFSAAVWADGRMDWPKDALDAGAAQRLSADLQAYTGAGQAEAWSSYSLEALKSFYDLGDEQVSRLPAVQAVRISVPYDLYEEDEDSGSFEAQVIEDEISFDGQTWFDLYEDLPETLTGSDVTEEEQ